MTTTCFLPLFYCVKKVKKLPLLAFSPLSTAFRNSLKGKQKRSRSWFPFLVIFRKMLFIERKS